MKDAIKKFSALPAEEKPEALRALCAQLRAASPEDIKKHCRKVFALFKEVSATEGKKIVTSVFDFKFASANNFHVYKETKEVYYHLSKNSNLDLN